MVVDRDPHEVTVILEEVANVVKVWKKQSAAQLVLAATEQDMEKPIQEIGSIDGTFAGSLSRLELLH